MESPKKSNRTINYIYHNCKSEENIPKDIVTQFDLMDEGNPMDPPRFSCERCGQEMVHLHYESLTGTTHNNRDLKKVKLRTSPKGLKT